MSNYYLSIKDRECLKEIGVPEHEMNGYGVVDAETFILREYYTNRREQGHDVPEEYQPQAAPRKEREIKYQEMMMFDLEGERVNRTPEGFPDPYLWYDEDEMCLCPDSKDWIPIWLRDKREKQEEREEKWLQYCREKHKRGRNEELSKKLQIIKEKKRSVMLCEAEERLKKALREREERLSKSKRS